MNDADLKHLYRRMTRDIAPELDAGAVAEPLARSGYADVEGTPLDRVAASAAQADLLRTALALGPDAAALARDVAALQRTRRPGPARAWLALAAGVGSAAILIAALRPDVAPAPATVEAQDEQAIFSMSFEGATATAAHIEPDEAGPIFNAGFDS